MYMYIYTCTCMYTYLDAKRGHDKIDVLYMYTTKEERVHYIQFIDIVQQGIFRGRGVGGSIPPLAEFYPPWKVIISHTH